MQSEIWASKTEGENIKAHLLHWKEGLAEQTPNFTRAVARTSESTGSIEGAGRQVQFVQNLGDERRERLGGGSIVRQPSLTEVVAILWRYSW